MNLANIRSKALSIVVLMIWMSFITFIVYDNLFLESELTLDETLQMSSLARGMFFDIGAISTVLAGWMILFTKNRWRWIFALGTIFLGSTFALPYIAALLWNRDADDSIGTS